METTIPEFSSQLDSLSDMAVKLNLVLFRKYEFNVEMFMHLQGINLR